MGASLTSLVTRLHHDERKHHRPRLEADPEVGKALQASLVAEQALYHRQRMEFQEQAQKKKDLKRISDQFEQMKEKIRKAQKEHKAAEAVVTASEFKKTFSLAVLGQGKKMGAQRDARKHASKSWSAFGQRPSSRPSKLTIGNSSRPRGTERWRTRSRKSGGSSLLSLCSIYSTSWSQGKKRRSPSSCMQRRSECWETCPR